MGASGRQLEEPPVRASAKRPPGGSMPMVGQETHGNQAKLISLKDAVNAISPPEHALDPSNRYAWQRFGQSEFVRKEYFEETLAAGTGDYLKLQAKLEEGGPPTNDAERDRFALRLKILVRLHALGLMAAHRAAMEGRESEIISSLKGMGKGGANKRSETVAMALQAAKQIRELNEIKANLVDSRSHLGRISSRAIKESRLGDEEAEAYLAEIREHITVFQDDDARGRFNYSVERFAKPDAQKGLWRAALWKLARDLAAWRQGQINVVGGVLYRLHAAFPFFAKTDAESVLQSTSEDDVVAQIRAGYVDLLKAIDVATIKIGAGDIEAFDLPEAVRQTIMQLSPVLQASAQRALADHRTVEFWKTMGLSGLQMAVALIPVVGPFVAAGIGAAQFGADIGSMLDKRALAAASNQPDRGMLGVEGPGSSNWAMLLVNAAMTIADLHSGVKIMRKSSAPMPMHELDFDVSKPSPAAESASAVTSNQTLALSQQEKLQLELAERFPGGFLSGTPASPAQVRGKPATAPRDVPSGVPPAWMLEDIKRGSLPPAAAEAPRAEMLAPPGAPSSGAREPKASRRPEMEAARRTPAEEQAYQRQIEEFKRSKPSGEFVREKPPVSNPEYRELIEAAEEFEDLSAGPPRNVLDKLSRAGTRRDQAFKKVTADVLRKQGLEGKLFTSEDWKELAELLELDANKVFKGDVLWEKVTGPDALFVDKANRVVKSVDLATSPSQAHFQQKAAQMQKLEDLLNSGRPAYFPALARNARVRLSPQGKERDQQDHAGRQQVQSAV